MPQMTKQEIHETWKEMTRRAIAEGRTTKCFECNDPIIPGHFVAQGVTRRWGILRKSVLLHAGFHFTLEKDDAFCESGAVGSGYWDGEKVVSEQEMRAQLGVF